MTRRRLPKDVREALAKLEPQVEAAFLAAIGDIRRTVDVGLVTRLIEGGDIEGAIRAMRFEASLFGPIDRALEESYRGGGIAAIKGLPVIRDPFDGGRVALGFDARSPRAERWARDTSSRLIVGIVEDQRTMAREAIRQGLEAGRGPRSTALDIVGRVNKVTGRREGGLLGLDGPRADRLRIVGDGMQTPEGVRGLVIKRKDGTLVMRYKVNSATETRILRAYKAGGAVPEPDRVLSMKQYSNQLLRDRGETIARTETITAYRAGRHDGFAQLVDSGVIRDDQIERVWSATGGPRTRDTHEGMNGETVTGIDTPWNVNGSQMLYPGDTSMGAAAEETINCRCFETVRIKQDVI